MGRLTVIAGSGALVDAVLQAAWGAGEIVQVVDLAGRGTYGPAQVLTATVADFAHPARLGQQIRAFEPDRIVMAGAVTVPDSVREGIGAAIGQSGSAAGDATLDSLAAAMEKFTGARLAGVHELVPDLVAGEGMLAGKAVYPDMFPYALFSLTIAQQIGALDIGQAVVTSGRRIVAVEDVAGTDALLARIATYRRDGMIGDGRSQLILAKARKPQQSDYVDLPAVGPGTISGMVAAGIALLVVESGRTLLLERSQLLKDAEANGISILGLS